MSDVSARGPLKRLPVWHRTSARTHLLVSVGAGAIVGIGLALAFGWVIGGFMAWVVAGSVFLIWTWASIWPLGPQETARLSQREDPSRPMRDLVLVLGAVVSVLAVALVIFRAQQSGPLRLGIGVASVIASWAVLHTIFTLKYAWLYYGDPVGGIDFKQDADPTYRDFAYIAFTVGMTFQVSDTDIGKATIRTTVLRHALLSFVFGTVIIAITINLVAGLSK
jgi:uncharacterized membrane protein